MSKPEKNIDFEDIQKILAFYPTLDEVASWFHCSPDTIERRVKEAWGCTFKEMRELGAGKTRLLLKRKAVSKALEEDNEKMLVYCLRTMTDLDDRKDTTEGASLKKILSLNYSLDFISEEEKNL